MALGAVVAHTGCIVAVMAGAARFSLFHVGHGGLQRPGLIREDLGVAVGAFIHAEMEVVAECRVSGIGLEGYGAGLEALVALVAIAGYGECLLIVMTGAARFTLFHLGHGYSFLSGYDLAIVA